MARRGKKPGSRKTGGRKRGTPLNVIARADVGMKPVAVRLHENSETVVLDLLNSTRPGSRLLAQGGEALQLAL
jgi:hypothetical protein